VNSKDHPTQPHAASKAAGRPGKRARHNLVALGSAAVLAAYAAGFLRTASAAHRLAAEERKRPGIPDGLNARAVAVDRAKLPPAQPPAAVESVQPRSATPATPVVLTTFTVAASAPVAAVEPPPAPVAPPPVAPAPAPAETPAKLIADVLATPVIPVAASPVAASTIAPPAAKPMYKDGVYSGWGSCRHGDLQASVTIKDGRIVVAEISECHTRYSKSVIVALPPEVIERQSADVDWVSGATESSDAFYYAVGEALKQAK
jgi:uncharacterized protein with FMN-binding domain